MERIKETRLKIKDNDILIFRRTNNEPIIEVIQEPSYGPVDGVKFLFTITLDELAGVLDYLNDGGSK